MALLIAVGSTSALSSADTARELNEEARQAKEEGMRLYGIRWRSVAIHHLEKAAEAGDVESMYTLGEIYRFMDRGMSREAIDWYHRAAEGGDPYAMLRLNWGMICELADICPEEHDSWAKMALDQELPKAEEGDPDAMLALYSVYVALEDVEEGRNWLRNAAAAGLPQAQDLWASRIQERSGDWPPRAEDVKAAEQGYAPAMNNLAGNLWRQDDVEGSWKWVVRGSEHGYVNNRVTYGRCHLKPEDRPYCPNDSDPIKGWLNREPPLSYFPPKYGL
ncbi:tetratricopeptide repeat protein [Alkalilimnicola ehrlichii MLHE-1]|nr:sel1 repeat family protein [Alkalilimnicola ehrlichii]